MNIKAYKLLVVSLLGMFAVGNVAYGQGEENLPIKEEAEQVAQDTIPENEGSDRVISPSFQIRDTDNLPGNTPKQSDILIIPARPLPNPATEENKPKIKETKSESRFNIFYYLIYKFRSKEGSGVI